MTSNACTSVYSEKYKSATPADIKSLCECIIPVQTDMTAVKTCLKKGNKIQKCEKFNVSSVRKSIVAKKKINIGERFTLKNLTAKRTLKGISPMNTYKFLNQKAKKNYQKDQIIL